MRYIDADALVEMYERSIKDDWNKKTSPTSWADAYECVIADIDDQPTADVVPREEVEKIFAEIEGLIDKHYNKHIFGCDLEDEEKEAVMNFSGDVTYDIDELKKKYTEDEG